MGREKEEEEEATRIKMPFIFCSSEAYIGYLRLYNYLLQATLCSLLHPSLSFFSSSLHVVYIPSGLLPFLYLSPSLTHSQPLFFLQLLTTVTPLPLSSPRLLPPFPNITFLHPFFIIWFPSSLLSFKHLDPSNILSLPVPFFHPLLLSLLGLSPFSILSKFPSSHISSSFILVHLPSLYVFLSLPYISPYSFLSSPLCLVSFTISLPSHQPSSSSLKASNTHSEVLQHPGSRLQSPRHPGLTHEVRQGVDGDGDAGHSEHGCQDAAVG